MKAEIIEKLAVLITTAFGLVAALAWNTAIQKIFQNIFGEQSSIAAMLFYAMVVTIIAVILTLWIGRLEDKAKRTEFRSLFRRKHPTNKAKYFKQNQ